MRDKGGDNANLNANVDDNDDVDVLKTRDTRISGKAERTIIITITNTDGSWTSQAAEPSATGSPQVGTDETDNGSGVDVLWFSVCDTEKGEGVIMNRRINTMET